MPVSQGTGCHQSPLGLIAGVQRKIITKGTLHSHKTVKKKHLWPEVSIVYIARRAAPIHRCRLSVLDGLQVIFLTSCPQRFLTVGVVVYTAIHTCTHTSSIVVYSRLCALIHYCEAHACKQNSLELTLNEGA